MDGLVLALFFVGVFLVGFYVGRVTTKSSDEMPPSPNGSSEGSTGGSGGGSTDDMEDPIDPKPQHQ